MGSRGLRPLAGCGAAPHKETLQGALTFRLYANLTKQEVRQRSRNNQRRPLADEIKSDKAFSHLRAAAVLFADALADERRLYLEE